MEKIRKVERVGVFVCLDGRWVSGLVGEYVCEREMREKGLLFKSFNGSSP